MKSVMKSFVLLAIAIVVAVPLSAQEKKKRGKRASLADQYIKRYEKAELTEEQVAKIKELAESAQGKIAAASSQAQITKEQRTAYQKALKEAREAKKKRSEATESAVAAAGLSADQVAAMKEQNKVRSDLNKAVLGLLSAEQKKKAGIKSRGNRKKKADA